MLHAILHSQWYAKWYLHDMYIVHDIKHDYEPLNWQPGILGTPHMLMLKGICLSITLTLGLTVSLSIQRQHTNPNPNSDFDPNCIAIICGTYILLISNHPRECVCITLLHITIT